MESGNLAKCRQRWQRKRGSRPDPASESAKTPWPPELVCRARRRRRRRFQSES